jgi:hypothetical protein
MLITPACSCTRTSLPGFGFQRPTPGVDLRLLPFCYSLHFRLA